MADGENIRRSGGRILQIVQEELRIRESEPHGEIRSNLPARLDVGSVAISVSAMDAALAKKLGLRVVSESDRKKLHTLSKRLSKRHRPS